MYNEICYSIKILNKYKNFFKILFNNNKEILEDLIRFFKLLYYSFIYKKYDTKLIYISNKLLYFLNQIHVNNYYPIYKIYLFCLINNIIKIKKKLIYICFKSDKNNNDKDYIKKLKFKYFNNKIIKYKKLIDNFKEKYNNCCCNNKRENINPNNNLNYIKCNLLNEYIKKFHILMSISKFYYENVQLFLNNFIVYDINKFTTSIDIKLYNTILSNYYNKFKKILVEIEILDTKKHKFKINPLFKINILIFTKNNIKYVVIKLNNIHILFTFLYTLNYNKMIKLINKDISKISDIIRILKINIFQLNQDLNYLNFDNNNCIN